MVGRRIAFINPFGTDAYDGIISETLGPLALADTELVVTNLIGAPENIDSGSWTPCSSRSARPWRSAALRWASFVSSRN